MKIKSKIIVPLVLLSLSTTALAVDYIVIIPASGYLSETPDPIEIAKDAWAEMGASIDKTMPPNYDWSEGLSWKRGCCGTKLTDLPDVKYPSETTNKINLHNHSGLTNIDALSSLRYIGEGGLNLSRTSVISLDPLKNTVISGGHVGLYSLGIGSLKGLEKMIDINYLYVYDNNLTNVTGLDNLESAAKIFAHDNDLDDISALSSFKKLGYSGEITLYGNPRLQDLSPLSNMDRLYSKWCGSNPSSPCATVLRVEDREYSVKLRSDSLICTKITSGHVDVKIGTTNQLATFSNICEL